MNEIYKKRLILYRQIQLEKLNINEEKQYKSVMENIKKLFEKAILQKAKSNDFHRVCKDIDNAMVLFHKKTVDILSVKIIEGVDIQKPENIKDSKCYFGQFKWNELPTPIATNFSSFQEILQQIQLTSRDQLQIIGKQQILKIKFQVGTKLKTCLFPLQAKQIGYEEELQLMLWYSEIRLDRGESLHHPYFNQVRHARLALQKQGEQMCVMKNNFQKLQERFKKQIQQLKVKFEGQIIEIKTQLQNVKNKMVEEQYQSSSQEVAVFSNKINASSAIAESTEVRNCQIIRIDQESRVQNQNIHIKDAYHFMMDKNNFHEPEYNCFTRQNQRFVYEKSDIKHRQLVSVHSLKRPASYFNIRVVKTKDSNISVGVLIFTRIKQISTNRQRGAISYKLKGGKQLYQNGQRFEQIIEQILEGQILTMVVNWRQQKIIWLKNNKCIITRSIPQQLIDMDLYPFVTMIHKNDQIEFV